RAMTHRVLEQIRAKYAEKGYPVGMETLAELFGVPEVQPRPRPARRDARPDAYYARLAAFYVRLVERGHGRPTATLAARHGVKPAQMRDRIREARERGLLTYFHGGRPGGQLTARAREMLGTPRLRPRGGTR